MLSLLTTECLRLCRKGCFQGAEEGAAGRGDVRTPATDEVALGVYQELLKVPADWAPKVFGAQFSEALKEGLRIGSLHGSFGKERKSHPVVYATEFFYLAV